MAFGTFGTQNAIYPPNLLDDSHHMISEPVLGNYGRDQDSREIFVTYTSHKHTYTIHNGSSIRYLKKLIK
jgi:hypothetical protein